MDFRRLGILAIMDVLLLAELTFGIWVSHFDRATIAWTFMETFVPLALVTILTARFFIKRLRPLPPVPGQDTDQIRPVGLFGALGNLTSFKPADKK